MPRAGGDGADEEGAPSLRDSADMMMDVAMAETGGMRFSTAADAATAAAPNAAALGTADEAAPQPAPAPMMAMVDLEHDPLNPALFAKTGAATLRKEAAQVGWLVKEGHFVKNWRRRYFVLWPDPDSAWSRQHAELTHQAVSRQLLVYYESPESISPKGVITLRRGDFQMASEMGSAYRGEDTLVLTVTTPQRKRYILRTDTPGDPTELRRWVDKIETGTLGRPLATPAEMAVVQLDPPVNFVVDCPQRTKAPGVRDCVAWRRSPAMEDLAGAADGADIDAGIEDGSAVRGVAENAEWVQAENGYWLPKKLVRRVRSWMPAAGVEEGVPPADAGAQPEARAAGAGAGAGAGLSGGLDPEAATGYKLTEATAARLLGAGWVWPSEEEQAAGSELVGRAVWVQGYGSGEVHSFHRQFGLGASSHAILFESERSSGVRAVKLRRKGANDPAKLPWLVQPVPGVVTSDPTCVSLLTHALAQLLFVLVCSSIF